MASPKGRPRGVVSSAADDPVELVLSMLPDAKRSGEGWAAKCPTHDDKNPSLSVSRGDEGRALVKCHAGCSTKEVCDALGIRVADLFPKSNGSAPPPKRLDTPKPKRDFEALALEYQRATDPDELEVFADSLGLDPDALRRLGVGWDGSAWCFPMKGVDGTVVGIRRRFPDGTKSSVKGGREGLFIPSELSTTATLFVCEGPTDCAALLGLGLDAIGRPSCTGGVAMTLEFCKGRNVVIMADDDTNKTGRKGADTLASELVSVCESVRIIEPPDGINDARSWVRVGCEAPDVQALADKAEPLTQANTAPVGNDWGEPIPFGVHDVPTFPIEAIPTQLEELRAFCEAAAESIQVSVDAVVMLVLAVGGAALAKRIEIEPKPGWREPVNLFVVVAMPSGERKSSLFRLVTQPLDDFEREENERLAPLIERNRNELALLDAELKQARSDAVKKRKPDEQLEARNISGELAEKIRMLEVVRPLQLVADDATPEAVSRLLDEQGGRLALLSAEGDVFDLMAGRYSDGVSRLGVFLKGHAGDAIRVNRIGRPNESVEDPALTCGLAVQPSVLSGLLEKPQLRGRGLLARFLYYLPASLVGFRKMEPDPIPGATLTAYDRLIRDALELQPSTDADGNPCPHIVTLSDEARAGLLQLREHVERALRDTGELSDLRDWGSKLSGAVCRIAGVFHGLMHARGGNPASVPVSAETMLGAITIGEYLVEHAKAAFQLMGSDPAIALAKRILRWLTDERLAEFTKRDAHRANRTPRADELDGPLGMLVERGYIREQFSERTGRGRPQSPTYEVNPAWLGQNGHNGQKSSESGIVSKLSILSKGGDF
jgi:putative DNA primase/helicase